MNNLNINNLSNNAAGLLFVCIVVCIAGCSDNPAEVSEHDKTVKTSSGAIIGQPYPRLEKQPNFGPRQGSITFADSDNTQMIGGTLTMGRAVDAQGHRLDEIAEGISAYTVHWGLPVGAPGVDDDIGAGDHGGNCRGFRDTGHVAMQRVEELKATSDTIRWELPAGTSVPEDAVYFVGYTVYGEVHNGEIHNLAKCTQTVINNRIDE